MIEMGYNVLKLSRKLISLVLKRRLADVDSKPILHTSRVSSVGTVLKCKIAGNHEPVLQ